MLNTAKFFRWALYFQIVYLMVALFFPVPAWNMFVKIDRPSFHIQAVESSQPIEVEKYLPPIYFGFSENEIIKLTAFICRKERMSLKLQIQTEPVQSYAFSKDDCQVSKL
jgi:hypothetical protein